MTYRRTVAWVLVVSGVLALARPARGEDQGSSVIQDWGWHLGLEALTDFPIQVGGRVSLETPYGLRASTSLGFLPGGYVDVINAVVVAAGGYDQDTADVVAGAISNSLVWRTHLGWRPFRGYGFYFELGYALIALGGDVSTEDLIVVATGIDPPANPSGDSREYDVASTLHMFDIELGWELIFWRHFIVRVALGVGITVAAATEIEPRFDPHPLAERGVETLSREGEDYLDDTYTTYVHPPAITVSLGYRFF